MLGPFKMGGLNGFPFTGLAGMGAFAHHVPIDGAVFVFHASPIGISRSGAVGEILRPSQLAPSACCGGAKAALGKLLKPQNPARRSDGTHLSTKRNRATLADAASGYCRRRAGNLPRQPPVRHIPDAMSSWWAQVSSTPITTLAPSPKFAA